MSILMRDGLRHEHAGISDEKFFSLIDATHRPADAEDSKGVGSAVRLPLPVPGLGVAFIDTPQPEVEAQSA